MMDSLYDLLHVSRSIRAVEYKEETGNHNMPVHMVLQFIDGTGFTGMGGLLKWAAGATGISQLEVLSKESVITKRRPGEKWGKRAKAKKPPKTAPCPPDHFMRWLMDQCHPPHPPERMGHAVYFTSCGSGGVRYADSQHTYDFNYEGKEPNPGAGVIFTASRFKATTDDAVPERWAISLYDYQGRSMRQALEALRAMMGGDYMLAAPEDARDPNSPTRLPKKQCTYEKASCMLRAFAAEWKATLPKEDPLRDIDLTRITIHSFKGWLDVLSKQAGFAQHEIEILLHWNAKQMHRRYDRNPMATELILRQKVIWLLNSDWRSAPCGFELEPPPKLSDFRCVTPMISGVPVRF